MSKKKVTAGHRGFLTGVLPDVDECLKIYEAEKKVKLAKWHTVLTEQLDKILPLDDSLQCRRILRGRNLVRVRNIVVVAIFDFMTVEDWGE